MISIILDILAIVGISSMIYGISLYSVPAAFVGGGMIVALLAGLIEFLRQKNAFKQSD